MDQSVVFTFLPQDEIPAGGRYRASLFVSPRLTPDGPGATAGDFPAFGDWPAIVSEARIVVERQGQGTETLDAVRDPLRSDLWTTYMAPLPVDAWEYHDLSSAEIRSFPAQSILALAQGLYEAVAAASGGGHPDPLAGGLRSLGSAYAELTGGSREQKDARVDDLLASRKARRRPTEHSDASGEPGSMAPRVTRLSPQAALADAGNAALDLAEARRFYDRPEARDPNEDVFERPVDGFVPPKLSPPEPDFHDALGALGDHPELLEALGIVIGVELPPAFVAGTGRYRAWLEHPRLDPNGISRQAWTRATTDGRFFRPVSETGDFVDGLLALDDEDRFDVAQVDVDSTALLVEQRVANVYPIASAVSKDEPVVGDLPALRSTGFTVTRLRREMILSDRIARSKSNANLLATGKGDQVTLFAEDLVRGFRIDVHDGTDWRSLMRRRVSYADRDTGAEVFGVKDQEAFVKASALTSVPDAGVDRRYLHEAVFGWDGWSLALPRPGKHLPVEPGDDQVTDQTKKFPGDLALEVRTDLVKGTLPRLRYGQGYRFRARTVDLAGHSTDFAADDPSTAKRLFRRFQPIVHPTTVPRHAFTEGESALRLVVRSGVDADNGDVTSPVQVVDPAMYAATLSAGTARTFGIFRADSQRHLVPPKTSQMEAELHRRFDDAIGLPGNGPTNVYRQAFARARREEGTLADRVVLSATDPAASIPVAGIHLMPPLARDGDFTAAQLDATLAALARGEAPDAGFYIIHDTNDLAVPYLPDPLAAGAALRFTGGGNASGWTHTELLAFDGTWPDLAAYRLVLVGGAAPGVTVANHVVTVTLPPGGVATVRVSSRLPDAATLDWLGMWEWIASTVPASGVAAVLDGAHQMITPAEDLVLVHATQRPLVRPSFGDDLGAVRALSETFTRFHGVLLAQTATSGRLDVDATWDEWVDDPAAGPPILVTDRTAHAFDFAPSEAADDALDLTSSETGDPKHEFGDHKHRHVAYQASATTRFREYLPPAETADVGLLRVVGPATRIHVPNSLRPPAPVVHSIIPTFGWVEEPADPLDALARARTRIGGLRVWLERPWYPSGEDEMLGVVLSGADELIDDGDIRRRYVSLWGKDPIRLGGRLPAAVPRPRDFSGDGLLHIDRLTIEETQAKHPGVSVVGHPVRYAPDRDKWYADLVVDPGEAYWPFLRLALSRLQPFSVPDAHLSRVVVTDFVQLTNRRTAAITRPTDELVRVTVTGIEERRATESLLAEEPPVAGGVFGAFPFFVELRPRGVRAWVERRGPSDSDLDWHRVGEVVELGRIDEDELMRVWQGDVELVVPIVTRRPGTDQDGGASPWRLVLTEWESLPLDQQTGSGRPIERIVYLDRFPL